MAAAVHPTPRIPGRELIHPPIGVSHSGNSEHLQPERAPAQGSPGGRAKAPISVAAYSVEGFAKAHSISRAQTWLLIQRGAIRTVRMGRRRLITAADAASWLSKLEAIPSKGGASS